MVVCPVQVSAFSTPPVLDRAFQIGGEAAKAQLPKLSKAIAGNAVLFGTVGVAYAGGKCLAEGITSQKHPINSG